MILTRIDHVRALLSSLVFTPTWRSKDRVNRVIVGAITHRLKRWTIQTHPFSLSSSCSCDSSPSLSGNDFSTESRRRRTCDRFPKPIAVKWPRRVLGDSARTVANTVRDRPGDVLVPAGSSIENYRRRYRCRESRYVVRNLSSHSGKLISKSKTASNLRFFKLRFIRDLFVWSLSGNNFDTRASCINFIDNKQRSTGYNS